MKIQNIDNSLRLHLLRHFSCLPDSYCKLHFTAEQLQDVDPALKAHRSKFDPAFATDPDELFNKVLSLSNEILSGKWDDNKEEFSFEYPQTLYSDGIGTDNLIFIPSLNKTQTLQLQQVEMGPQHYQVAYVDLQHQLRTWKLNVILLRENDQIRILTIFPGTMAPPLPDIVIHSPVQYRKYDQFWKQHAFIIFPG
jgi:hypothetical protein